jgi:hypothetical protein
MLLTPDDSSRTSWVTRHDAVFVLLLSMALLLATSTFFATFAVAALIAGLLLSLVLHRSVRLHEGVGGAPRDPLIGINFAAIHVGGDAGGLIFVLGSIAILALGLPVLRVFLIVSVATASTIALARIAWTKAH